RVVLRPGAAPEARPRRAAAAVSRPRGVERPRILRAAPCALRRAGGRAGAPAPGGRQDHRDGAAAARPRGCILAAHWKMSGFQTLLHKELLRFWKVAVQTVAAPVLTAVLYLLVFAYALQGRVR